LSRKEDKQAFSSRVLKLAEKAERIALDLEAYSLLIAKYNQKLKGEPVDERRR
jgi:hypothetical protein